MKDIYGLVEYGEYEEYNFAMIKIKARDKEKLEQYCNDSQKINDSGNYTLTLLGWVDNLEIIDKNFDWLHVIDIKKHQQGIKATLKDIDEMNKDENKWKRHYLRHKRDELLKLLEYEF